MIFCCLVRLVGWETLYIWVDTKYFGRPLLRGRELRVLFDFFFLRS